MESQMKLLLPALCSIGIFGNSMALLLIRTNYWLRRLPSNVYLSVLSLSSTVFLSTVLLMWFDLYFHLPVYAQNSVGCKLITFIAHACDFVCVWMIVFVSCDRAIILFRPGRICCSTKASANRLVIAVCTIAMLLYSWCLVLADLEVTHIEMTTDEHRVITECGLVVSNTNGSSIDLNQFYMIFTAADTIVSNLLPSLLIVVVNSIAIWRYRQCMRCYSKAGIMRVRFLRSSVDNDGGNGGPVGATRRLLLVSRPHTTMSPTLTPRCYNQTSTGGGATAISANPPASAWCKMRTSELQLSRSLLIVTSTFVLFNLPNYAFRLYQSVSVNTGDMQPPPPSDEADDQFGIFSILNFVAYLLYYFHHAVLFYLYIFWSPQMKKQLKPTAIKLLECYCCKTVPEFGHGVGGGGGGVGGGTVKKPTSRPISANILRRID